MKQKLLLFGTGFLIFCCQITSAQVVISEIYGGGGNSGAVFNNDFIELYNAGTTPVSLAGWSVQYASSTGTFNTSNITTLTGSISAKGFYLIKQGGGNSTSFPDLPAADVSGSVAMAGASGKVALVRNNISITGIDDVDLVDLIGYGTAANLAEGGSPTANLSNSTSAERKASATSSAATLGVGGTEINDGNGYDSNNNAADFVIQTTVNPQNSSVKEPETGLFPAESVVNFESQYVGQSSIAKLLKLNYKNLTAVDVDFSVSSPFSISKSAAGPYGNSLTFNSTALSGGSIIDIYIKVNLGATGIATGSLTFSGGGVPDGQVDLTANGVVPLTTTLISTIQGSGITATSGDFTVEAIVTGVYGSLDPAGFYIQEEDGDHDADPNTSEGIFVAQANPTVAIGDKVLVTGTVQENGLMPSFNQAVITNAAISVVSLNNTAPAFSVINNNDFSPAAAEKFEGMRVQFASDLIVSNNTSLAQYGELSLSTSGSVYTATQIVDPNDDPATGTSSTGTGNVAAINAYIAANTNKTITLDDGSGVSNPTPIPYLDPALATLRINSTISSLKGIMGYGFSKYRIQPLPGGDAPVFTVSRPAVPTFTNSNIKLASFNVLNYFNGNGQGGGFPTSRGATTAAAFAIQRSKIIKAISQLGADVVGLLEIENDGVGSLSAVQDLVNGLNTEIGVANTYAVVDDGAAIQTGNTDEIRCAIIYKPANVTPVGAAMLTGVSGNRPFLAQTFTTPANANPANEKFNFIVNHFKSKGGTGTGADADQGDGQSAFNATRKIQAAALIAFINGTVTSTSGTDRVVSVGDYNAYFEEDPMDVLRDAGLIVGSSGTAHSYLFDGALGSLDHAVVSSSMRGMVSIQKWNINSNETTFLQYTNAIYTDATSPFRSSDHDPILIGVNFSGALPVNLVSFNAREENKQVRLNWKTTSEKNNSHFTVQRSADAVIFNDIAVVDGAGNSSNLQIYTFLDTSPLNGLSYYRLKQSDLDGTFTNSRIVTVKLNGEADQELTVYPNPVTNHLTLELQGKIASAKVLNYEIVGQDGVKLFSGKGSLSEINKNVDRALPEIKTGTYLIRITGADETHVFRFVRQ